MQQPLLHFGQFIWTLIQIICSKIFAMKTKQEYSILLGILHNTKKKPETIRSI